MVCCYYNFSGERIKGVKDSKLVIKKTQRSLFKQLTKKGQFVVVPATVNTIERDGIYVARNHAVIAAVNLMLMSMKHSKIDTSNVTVLLDGYWSQNWILIFERLCGVKFEGVVDGDAKIYEKGIISTTINVQEAKKEWSVTNLQSKELCTRLVEEHHGRKGKDRKRSWT